MLMLKRLRYAIKQYPRFSLPPLPQTEPPNLRPILRPPPRPFLRPPPRPFLRPPPPLKPFLLPPPKQNKKFPRMLMTPPPPPPKHLLMRKPLRYNGYTEINKQIFERPKNLMMEITLTTCKNRLANHLPRLDPCWEMIMSKPSIRVHGLRLCFLDDNNNLCYLNHQNQKYLDRSSRIQESEAARSYILNDLELNHYDIHCIDELASIWYDDSDRDPVDFWIYQFLKHGYFALDDPMIDYASRVGNECLPWLLPSSFLADRLPDSSFSGELGPDFGDYGDYDLGTYLLEEGFRTNQYHFAEKLRSDVERFCISKPRLTYIHQEGHTCLREISLLRSHPDGFSIDHPLSIPLHGCFLMRMI